MPAGSGFKRAIQSVLIAEFDDQSFRSYRRRGDVSANMRDLVRLEQQLIILGLHSCGRGTEHRSEVRSDRIEQSFHRNSFGFDLVGAEDEICAVGGDRAGRMIALPSAQTVSSSFPRWQIQSHVELSWCG